MILDVNNSDVIKHVNKLERIRSKSMPYAIRNTLNNVAFDTRKEQLKRTKKQFVNRNRTFFRSRINAKRAKGLDVNKMESASGVYAKNNSKEEQPVWNLKEQDQGGKLFVGAVPTKAARGGSNRNKIKPENRLSRAKVKGSMKWKGKGHWMRKHFVAAKTGKLIKTKTIIYRVHELSSTLDRKISFKREILYYRDYTKRGYRKRPFIDVSTKVGREQINKTFIKNMNKQLEFLAKKRK